MQQNWGGKLTATRGTQGFSKVILKSNAFLVITKNSGALMTLSH